MWKVVSFDTRRLWRYFDLQSFWYFVHRKVASKIVYIFSDTLLRWLPPLLQIAVIISRKQTFPFIPYWVVVWRNCKERWDDLRKIHKLWFSFITYKLCLVLNIVGRYAVPWYYILFASGNALLVYDVYFHFQLFMQ